MKWRMYSDTGYLIILAATLGAILVLGIFTAPVVFNTGMLSHYEEGMIMAEIFRRFTYWLYLTFLVMVIYEGYQFKIFKRDAIATLAALTSIATILMFNAVYTQKILAMQKQGEAATQSEAFANIHLASEIDFKILAVALAILFVRRYYLITHPNR
jgi:hypothetical protein